MHGRRRCSLMFRDVGPANFVFGFARNADMRSDGRRGSRACHMKGKGPDRQRRLSATFRRRPDADDQDRFPNHTAVAPSSGPMDASQAESAVLLCGAESPLQSAALADADPACGPIRPIRARRNCAVGRQAWNGIRARMPQPAASPAGGRLPIFLQEWCSAPRAV